MIVRFNLFCMFNQTGVGRHCENAYLAILRNRPQGLHLNYANAARGASVRRMVRDAREGTDVNGFFWRIPAAEIHQFRGRSFFWWFFESDRIPQKWLEDILVYDEVWAPSAWARDVLLAHEVDPASVRVVESGVNTDIFFPDPEVREPPKPDRFAFLLVGKYEGRKSIDETVQAFSAEFPLVRYPLVELRLKADFPLYPQRVHELARRVSNDPRIRIISGNLTDPQMARIYRDADAFVFPTKAEGFGLPCIEALACGLPVITTPVSAQTAFLDQVAGLYAPVEYKMAPIVDPDYTRFYGADYAGEPLGNWALPSIDSLRACMRDVYEHRAAWRDRAAQASAIIRREFSWDAIGRKAIEAALALRRREI